MMFTGTPDYVPGLQEGGMDLPNFHWAKLFFWGKIKVLAENKELLGGN